MVAYTQNDRKWVAVFSIIAGILSLACMVTGFIATDFDVDAFSDPTSLLVMERLDEDLLRLFMILDLFGYYLLLLPVMFFLNDILQMRTAWASFFTSMGYGYVIIGSIGAVVLSIIWPELITQHRAADPAMKQVLAADFTLATNFVVKGLWNHLEVLLGGVWWIGLGVLAIEQRALKFTTVALGVSCLLDSAGEMMHIKWLAEVGLNLYLVLAIIWPVWLGIRIWKQA